MGRLLLLSCFQGHNTEIAPQIIDMKAIHNSTGNISATTVGQSFTRKPLFEQPIDTIITVVYTTISILVVASNLLVCLLFCKDSRMRRPFNIILFNLSLADMISGFAIQPYIWIDYTRITDHGTMGGFLCSVSVGVLGFMYCIATAVLSLCAVTILRYLSIVRNNRGFFVTSTTFATFFCISTWITGLGLTVPSGMSFEYDTNQSTCHRTWPSGVDGGLYSLLTTFIYLLLPIILMTACYTSLVIHIWKRSLEAPDRNIAAVRSRRSVAVLLGLLISTLVLCWTPFSVVWIVGRLFKHFPDGPQGEYERQRWLRIAMIFALINTGLDPFIYVYSSSEYRKGVMKILRIRKNRTDVSTQNGMSLDRVNTHDDRQRTRYR